jgi:hypothetical protein
MTKAETPKVGQIVLHQFLWADEQASRRMEVKYGGDGNVPLRDVIQPVG